MIAPCANDSHQIEHQLSSPKQIVLYKIETICCEYALKIAYKRIVSLNANTSLGILFWCFRFLTAEVGHGQIISKTSFAFIIYSSKERIRYPLNLASNVFKRVIVRKRDWGDFEMVVISMLPFGKTSHNSADDGEAERARHFEHAVLFISSIVDFRPPNFECSPPLKLT